ncbi:MAG: zinc ribbon domain-containing protein [Acidobacteriota bacterium]
MFCPSCGSEERQASQYCRACGTDLRPVRLSLERPDAITASAISAREEIGRAVADKIRAVDNASDLKSVAEDVLPQIEKFLDSPEEKRLRRLRAGVVTALIGLGAWIPALALTTVMGKADELFFLYVVTGLGSITFALGLGLVINGLLFTRPGKAVADNSEEAQVQNLLDAGYAAPQLRPGSESAAPLHAQTTSNLAKVAGSSVTEHTTHHLKTER